MSERSDGGGAFPEQVVHSEAHGFMPASVFSGEEGLSKRDWFAGHALAGVVGSITGAGTATKDERAKVFGQIADIVYEIADAMLAAHKPKV